MALVLDFACSDRILSFPNYAFNYKLACSSSGFKSMMYDGFSGSVPMSLSRLFYSNLDLLYFNSNYLSVLERNIFTFYFALFSSVVVAENPGKFVVQLKEFFGICKCMSLVSIGFWLEFTWLIESNWTLSYRKGDAFRRIPLLDTDSPSVSLGRGTLLFESSRGEFWQNWTFFVLMWDLDSVFINFDPLESSG